MTGVPTGAITPLARTAGLIPASNALAEAAPDSLNELFNRDPEKLSTGDLARLVEALREQRKRWAAAEAAGGRGRSPARSPAPSTNNGPPPKVEDLGL